MAKKEKNPNKKRRFRWWHIPVTLIVLILVAVIGLMGFMLSMLPPQNLVAATSNFQLELSDKMLDYALSGERDYSTLPDALVMADGTPVKKLPIPPRFLSCRKRGVFS